MFRRVAYLAVSALTLATALTSCASFKYEPREAWRAQAERACMSEHPFRRDPNIEQLGRIRDHLICGMIKPLSVSALQAESLSSSQASFSVKRARSDSASRSFFKQR